MKASLPSERVRTEGNRATFGYWLYVAKSVFSEVIWPLIEFLGKGLRR